MWLDQHAERRQQKTPPKRGLVWLRGLDLVAVIRWRLPHNPGPRAAGFADLDAKSRLSGHDDIADICESDHTKPMSGYDELDDTIKKWSDFPVFTEWAGSPARYFYLPGDPPFECFQVNITLLRDDKVAVRASAVDTNDDTETEMDQTWEGPVSDLDRMLGVARAAIDSWKTRERTRPDPPSPWP